jgi:hypothetical protein
VELFPARSTERRWRRCRQHGFKSGVAGFRAADLRDEPIAAAGLGHDEPVIFGRLAENASQRRDVLVEIAFLDDKIRPDRLEQRAPVQRLPGVLDEIEQRVEDLRLERDRLTPDTRQHASQRVETVVAELVDQLCLGLIHRG